MRTLVLILAIAVAFGAAAAWQSRKVAALKAERVRAAAIADGLLTQTPSGEVEAGWAVVTIGRTAARDATDELDDSTESARQADSQPQQGAAEGDEAPLPSAPEPAQPQDDGWSSDWELTVEAGQSLSKIAAAHYGTAPSELIAALARYNGLSSPDELREGQRLRLPPLDVLLRQ